MQNKYIAIIVAVVIVVIGAIVLINKPTNQPTNETETVSPSAGMPVPGTNTPEMIVGEEATPTPETTPAVTTPQVKEFTMRSWYSPEDKRPYFSLGEIVVNQGDIVRLKVTNTFGNHDIKIDEFNVFAETPLNQETVVEFVADKAGEFVYYCSKPGHRAAGQWGTLKVLAR